MLPYIIQYPTVIANRTAFSLSRHYLLMMIDIKKEAIPFSTLSDRNNFFNL